MCCYRKLQHWCARSRCSSALAANTCLVYLQAGQDQGFASVHSTNCGCLIMPTCLVKNCRTNWRRKEENMILHCFPKNLKRIILWIQQTGQFIDNCDNVAQRILHGGDSYRMCSKHFTPDSYITGGRRILLKKDAIPTLFPTDIQITGLTPKLPQKRMRIEDDPTLSSSEVQLEASSATMQSTSKDVIKTSMQELSKISSIAEVSQTAPDTFVEHQDKEICLPIEKSTSRGNNVLKPYVRTKQTLYTTVDPFMWMSSKKVGTQTIKMKEKATQVVAWTQEVGVQCSLPMSANCHGPPLKNVNVDTHPEIASPQQVFEQTFLNPGPFSTGHLIVGLPFSPTAMHHSHLLGTNAISLSSQCNVSSIRDGPSNSETTKESDSSPEECTQEKKPFIAIPETKPTNIKDRKCIVLESCLNRLLQLVPCQFQEKCTSPISKIWKTIQGNFLSVYVRCEAGHSVKLWDSEPKE